ncbi:MAG: PLP-dependent aminotransferase family protein [Ktedonobacteraceae bacterium]|nr:PLP-dependent aminotransferase family protein [Ktedonobacteraceae bacterium]
MGQKATGKIAPDLALPLTLTRTRHKPLHRQLAEQLREAILRGVLAPGIRLPSSRALAKELGISRNIVLAVYEELLIEGYLIGRHGSGTSVSSDLPRLERAEGATAQERPRWLTQTIPWLDDGESPPSNQPGVIDFRLGATSTALWPEGVWRKIWREVSKQPLPGDYQEPVGDLALRTAVASYVGRARGVACQAEDVIITTSAVQALHLIAQATLDSGRSVALEDPGYPRARAIFQHRQARLIPIPVDTDGLRVEDLPQGAAAPHLVYVTPSHQFPLGVRLSIVRRLALLEWARENESLIIEDDYDSEFRFGAQPLPALAGLDHLSRVAYIGTFAKLLTPSLRLGYVIAPRPLREYMAQAKILSDVHPSWLLQQALVHFFKEGYLERYIQRLRYHYAQKRATLVEALAPLTNQIQIAGLEAGLHTCLELSAGLREKKVIVRAAKRGIMVYPLSRHYLGTPDKHALLLGYGGLTDEQIRQGAEQLVAAIQEEW